MARPQFELSSPIRFVIPVGGLVDIPTGMYLRGTHDQRVLLGGLAPITGFVGPGNSFKTTLAESLLISAINRMISTCFETTANKYDTEANTNETRVNRIASNFEYLEGLDLINEGIWMPTSIENYSGNKWFAQLKQNLTDRLDPKNKHELFETAFLGRDGVTPHKVMAPWFSLVDSLTKFSVDVVDDMLEKTELGSSDANTLYMKLGLAKQRLLMEVPYLSSKGMNYFMFTGHIGKTITIPTGPTAQPDRKQLQHMNQGEVIKGVSNNFFYLTHNCWLMNSARPYLDKNTKGPLYPPNQGEEIAGDLDLNIVTAKILRGKNGGSGFALELLMSQSEGFLIPLTEFHHVKENGHYGMIGNDRTYALELYPDVKLGRTTIRQLLREDRKLRRAVEITSQLKQISDFHRHLRPQLVEPGDLRRILEEKGYDWNWLLDNTRSWHTLNDEQHPDYPLSTLDLCRVAKGEYHPYWLEADCKTVKQKYADLKIGKK